VDSAHALNGNIYVTDCACQTTSDFASAAIQASNDQGWGGTYLVSSTSQAKTALMQVHGKHLIDKFGNDYWLASSALPMDNSGNSLGGQSESAQESFYQTYDQVTYTADRTNPLQIVLPTTSIVPSFVCLPDGCNTDVQVSQIL